MTIDHTLIGADYFLTQVCSPLRFVQDAQIILGWFTEGSAYNNDALQRTCEGWAPFIPSSLTRWRHLCTFDIFRHMEPLCLKRQMTLLLRDMSVFSLDAAALVKPSNRMSVHSSKKFSAKQNRVLYVLMFRGSGTTAHCLSAFDPVKLHTYLTQSQVWDGYDPPSSGEIKARQIAFEKGLPISPPTCGVSVRRIRREIESDWMNRPYL